jgi:hypothetical protein
MLIPYANSIGLKNPPRLFIRSLIKPLFHHRQAGIRRISLALLFPESLSTFPSTNIT